MTDTNTANIPAYPFGGHAFVWARPKDKDWQKFDGTNGLGDGPREFRPCKVSGQDNGRRIMVLGSQYAHELDGFEIAGPCIMPESLRPKPPAPAKAPAVSRREPEVAADLGPIRPVARSWSGGVLDALDLAQREGAQEHLEGVGFVVVALPDKEDYYLIDDERETNGEDLIEMARDLDYDPPGYGL